MFTCLRHLLKFVEISFASICVNAIFERISFLEDYEEEKTRNKIEKVSASSRRISFVVFVWFTTKIRKTHKKIRKILSISYYFHYYQIRAKLHLLLKRERCDLALKRSVWIVIIRQIEIKIKRIFWSIELNIKTLYFEAITFERTFQNKLFKEVKRNIKQKLFNMNNETSLSSQDVLSFDQSSLKHMIEKQSTLNQSNSNDLNANQSSQNQVDEQI